MNPARIAQHQRITALEAIVVEQCAMSVTLTAGMTPFIQRVGKLLAARGARTDAGTQPDHWHVRPRNSGPSGGSSRLSATGWD